MTGVVTIHVDAAVARERVQRALDAIQLRPLLTRIGQRLKGFVDESFKTRGRGTWAPLSPLTIMMRRKSSSAPLQDTGGYKQSWTTRTFENPGNAYAEVGTAKVPLAFWLEYGTGAKAVGGGSPYTIRVRNAKVLAGLVGGGFSTRKNAQWIFFGKEVTHPGIPPRPVLPTQAQGEALLQQVIEGVERQIEGKG